MPFDEFVNWALYDPNIGYYRTRRKRVGKDASNDFYTSTSLGRVWGELILDASLKLLAKRPPSKFVFVEIGAEPETSILDGLKHPFAHHKVIRLGDKIEIPRNAIVYSNEWLDAQPFKRFKYDKKRGTWLELFVGLSDFKLVLIEKKTENPLVLSFPNPVNDGYLIDWPSGSISSLNELASNPSWFGVFMTFDYGLTRSCLFNDRPEGTARAYSKHKMLSELLSNPGEQDLTCHLCWDNLRESLELAGFKNVTLASQESFLMTHSHAQIKEIFEQNKTPMNNKMLALRELIHPAHLGHGLQALSAVRF